MLFRSAAFAQHLLAYDLPLHLLAYMYIYNLQLQAQHLLAYDPKLHCYICSSMTLSATRARLLVVQHTTCNLQLQLHLLHLLTISARLCQHPLHLLIYIYNLQLHLHLLHLLVYIHNLQQQLHLLHLLVYIYNLQQQLHLLHLLANIYICAPGGSSTHNTSMGVISAPDWMSCMKVWTCMTGRA